jgi:hypothetical protein
VSKDFGDFQTPPALVRAILDSLQASGKIWQRVLEPTCGQGNFISGLLSMPLPPREIQGIEIQARHAEVARGLLSQDVPKHGVIHQANIFDLHLGRDLSWQENGALLVVGNPPWVTNAGLGASGGTNLPQKTNLKRLPGLDAMTGSANFDIAEFIWLKLIRELADQHPTVALLCKTSVARNVLQFAAEAGLPISSAVIRKIDAKHWFGAAVDACLFCVEVGQLAQRYEAQVYADLQSAVPIATIGVIAGQLVSNLTVHATIGRLDGTSSLTWRQGLKHDAASVVELTMDESGSLRNKLNELVDIEPSYLYPLLKSSDIGGKGGPRGTKFVILPQTHLGDDTRLLKHLAPRLWAYLSAHAEVFERRKSSIYRNQPPFAYFGLGSYSFAPYKVAISGFYKTPVFRAIGPIDGRPVMLDDTCYFLACRSIEQAALIVSLLHDPICHVLLASITFWDAKRPITKKLLQRIDLLALLHQIEQPALVRRVQAELQRLGGTPEHQKRLEISPLEDLLLDQFDNLSDVIQPALLRG